MEGNGKENSGRRDGRKTAVMLKGFFMLGACLVFSFSACFAGGCGCDSDESFFEHEESSVSVPDTFQVSRENTITSKAVHVPKAEKLLHAKEPASMPVEVHPERTVWVELSNTDLNRVVCSNGDISDVLFSQEKGIKVKTAGSDAYIKFMIQAAQTPDEKPERVNVPSEFYLVCAGETYSFIQGLSLCPQGQYISYQNGPGLRK